MVRYLTMRLWPSSRIQIRMRPLLSFYCAGYCFVCNLLEQYSVCSLYLSVERGVGGETSSLHSFFSQLYYCLLANSYVCVDMTVLSPKSISVDSASDIPALHTRHGVISLQEHLHIVTATHLERPNLYLIEIRYPDPLKPNYLFLRDFCHTIFSNQCLYS